MSRSRVCELVLTSYRNVVITLIHRDSASWIASTRRYFACYPQQALVVLECDFKRKAIFKLLLEDKHCVRAGNSELISSKWHTNSSQAPAQASCDPMRVFARFFGAL